MAALPAAERWCGGAGLRLPDAPSFGYHGTALVFEVTNRNAGLLAYARDLDTCERLWELPAPLESLDRIWRIDGTVVHMSNNGTQLNSLVAPG